jgi:hypothetical protein
MIMIWNVNDTCAMKVLWELQETGKDTSLYFIANCYISQFRHNGVSRRNQDFFSVMAGEDVLHTLDKVIVNVL